MHAAFGELDVSLILFGIGCISRERPRLDLVAQ
jgi:hypothetical protein